MQIKKSWIALGIVGLLVLWFIGSIIGNYNKLVDLETRVDTQYAQVDVVLQRRNDLIPNLVKTVKAYSIQEKEIFTQIAEARAKLAGAGTTNQKVQAHNELSGFLSRLLVIVERYPNLKANQNFLKLQDQLEGSENRISVERNRYNQTVGQYNRIRRSFPTLIWGGFFGFDMKKEFFKAPEEAKQVPEVNFN